MSKTIIRPARAADFPILLEIDAESFPPEIAYDSGELSWFMTRQGAETIVLERDGAVEGFLIIEVHYRTRTATLVTMDVRQHCRRLGYGTILLGRSEEIALAQDVKTFRLQVDVNNAPAIRFYEKHGFHSVRKLNNYYSDSHDAWLMTKTLPQTGGT